MIRGAFEYLLKYKRLLLVVLPAFFVYMLVIFPSGSFYCIDSECGYYFWGAHGRDAIWHLAITETSFRHIPFTNPAYVGAELTGYNWLLDLFIFLLTKLGIPSIVTYFKLIPVAWFFFFTLLLIQLGRKIKNTPLFVGLFLFLSYFAGSFSYLLKLYHTGTIRNSSLLLPQPVIHTMSNLQYAISFLLFLILLILIKDGKISMRKILLAGLLLFAMLGLKFYGGAIGIFLFFAYLFFSWIRDVKNLKRYFTYFLMCSLFISSAIIIFYNPFSATRTGFPFSFSPFALVHTITEAPDQFYLRDMTDARYFLAGKLGPRLIAIELINLLIFLVFYFGTRFFGLLYLPILFLKRKLDRFDAAVMVTILFSLLLTIFLVQKGVWWNTIQFFFYALVLSTIYLAKLIFGLLKSKRKVLIVIAVLVTVLSVPTSYDVARHFLMESKPVYLPKDEIEALVFLKKQPDGVVLSPLFVKNWKKKYIQFPLNHFEDSSYVAAFSGKQLYFAEAQTLEVTNVPTESRLEKIKRRDCLILSEVDYVYELSVTGKGDRILATCTNRNVRKIFANATVAIYSLR